MGPDYPKTLTSNAMTRNIRKSYTLPHPARGGPATLGFFLTVLLDLLEVNPKGTFDPDFVTK